LSELLVGDLHRSSTKIQYIYHSELPPLAKTRGQGSTKSPTPLRSNPAGIILESSGRSPDAVKTNLGMLAPPEDVGRADRWSRWSYELRSPTTLSSVLAGGLLEVESSRRSSGAAKAISGVLYAAGGGGPRGPLVEVELWRDY
jgi:hypothetical protein